VTGGVGQGVVQNNARSKELNELVYSNVPGPGKCYWVGISDIEAENKWGSFSYLRLFGLVNYD
jgi:hypothetical protein